MTQASVVLSPEDVLPCFTNPSELIRAASFKQAAAMPSDPVICEAILEALSRPNEVQMVLLVMFEAVKVHCTANVSAQKLLISLLNHTDPWVILDAAQTLAAIGGNRRQAVGAISMHLRSPDPDLQKKALDLLYDLQPEVALATGFIVDIARDVNSDLRVRGRAIQVLRCMAYNMNAELLVHTHSLAPLLLDRNSEVVAGVLYILEQVGANVNSVPHLIEALNFRDSNGTFDSRFVGIMGEIDMHEIVAITLGRIGSRASQAIPALEELLTRPLSAEEAQRKIEELIKKEFAEPREPVDGRKRHGFLILDRIKQRRSELPIKITSKGAKIAAEKALELIKSPEPVVSK